MIKSRNLSFSPTLLKARSPAKLIISGEHAVLYGQPAIAMAIDRYTTTTTTWHDSPHIHFKFIDLAYAKTQTMHALRTLSKQLRSDYTEFLHGRCGIRDVIKRPFELLQYSVASVLERMQMQLPRGVEISVDSNIPVGCGMGSSAAAVISTLYALANFLKLNWQRSDYLQFGREVENLQHGRSSGLDLHLVTNGGCVLFQDSCVTPRATPSIPLYIVNTGKPESTTGECVSSVAKILRDNVVLHKDFCDVTLAVDAALINSNLSDFNLAIRENNRLLQHLGVVPNKVASLIAEIEQQGGAAKVCGAGAIAGDNAGVVLLSGDQNLATIVNKYGYQMQHIQVDTDGTQII